MYHMTVPANPGGRDFIVGDLHGCYDLLMAALAANKFDFHVDRLFSVGDLVDRGPDSFKCLKLLKETWFYAVAGNHEFALSHALNHHNEPWFGTFEYLSNDGAWLLGLEDGQQRELSEELLPLLFALPVALAVEDADHPFNVVHAEAANERRVFMDAELAMSGGRGDMQECLQWGRLLRDEYVKNQRLHASRHVGRIAVSQMPFDEDLSLTYCGHSIVQQPLLHRSHLFLDQGAYLPTGRLNLVNHRTVIADLVAANVLQTDSISTF